MHERDHGIVTTEHQRGNLKIIPAGYTDRSIDFVKGQEEPVVQGWYSRQYNMYEPNTATIYSDRINSDSTFVWILFPSEEAAPKIDVDVLSQDSDAVQVRVSIPEKGSWNIYIPFLNSADADMKFISECSY